MAKMDLEGARDLLRRNRFCVLATSTLDGRPWVTPLFFNFDASLTFVWESGRDAFHSRLLADNPLAAIVVGETETLEAVYFECRASEVTPEGLEEALETFKHGPHRKRDVQDRVPEDYRSERPLRLYEGRPYAAYTLTQVQTAEGYVVDQRTQIDLPDRA